MCLETAVGEDDQVLVFLNTGFTFVDLLLDHLGTEGWGLSDLHHQSAVLVAIAGGASSLDGYRALHNDININRSYNTEQRGKKRVDVSDRELNGLKLPWSKVGLS